ncbi:MAG: UDP-galactopyranose mutase [halophilic archaeon J07HX64]|jgi:UDP-galactopyranose mutase (EC 5.4.99.9)|nr:MAG: UDP-galactopyranose mutase [halophilic archaeon J07HX64]
MTDVVVAGGGLAGLVAARHLADEGLAVTLFERDDRLGGRVHSDHQNGFTFDRGFQVVFSSYPAVVAELDREALSLRPFAPGATLARPGRRTTVADPFADLVAGVRTLFNRDITVGDKLRVLRLRQELLRASAEELLDNDGQTIESYLEARGFSERFRERFAAPFYGGITLDRSLSSSRAVFEYTFKMLAQGTAAVPAAGMGAIPDQLAARAQTSGVTVETGTPVESVTPERQERGVTVETPAETVGADAAVVATDPESARELTGCERIPTAGRGCVTQYFSLPEHQQLDTGNRLLLNAADGRPNQVAVLSAAAPEYAPDGSHLLSATFLGEQSADNGSLAAEVAESLAAWYPEHSVAGLELLRTDRIEFAQFSQPPGFRSDLPDVDEPAGQVYLAGDYTEWSAIQGAMESGQRAARSVVETRSPPD